MSIVGRRMLPHATLSPVGNNTGEVGLILSQFFHYLSQLGQFLWVKLAIGVTVASFADIQLALGAMLVLYFVDFALGVSIGWKTGTLSSRAMRRGIVKGLVYFAMIYCIRTLEVGVIGDWWETNLLSGAFIAVVAVTELLSISENLLVLGLPIPVFQKWATKIAGFNLGMKDVGALVGDQRAIMEVVAVDIPALKNEELKIVLKNYARGWFEFLQYDPSDYNQMLPGRRWIELQGQLRRMHRALVERSLEQLSTARVLRKFDSWTSRMVGETMLMMNQATKADSSHALVCHLGATMVIRVMNKAHDWDHFFETGELPSTTMSVARGRVDGCALRDHGLCTEAACNSGECRMSLASQIDEVEHLLNAVRGQGTALYRKIPGGQEHESGDGLDDLLRDDPPSEPRAS